MVADETLDMVRCDVDVRDNLTAEEFARDYWGKNRPVLIRRAIDPTKSRRGYTEWVRALLAYGRCNHVGGYYLRISLMIFSH